MNTPSFFRHVSSACAALSALFIVSASHAEVPVSMRKDFVTARNHIAMKWNPQGYWISPPGAFVGKGNFSEVSAAFTQTELSRGKIPQGYSFSVNGAGQFVVSNGPITRSVPPPAPAALPAPAPVEKKIDAPIPPAPVTVAPKPVPAPKAIPVVETAPPPPPVKKVEPVAATPPPAPVIAPTPAMRAAVLDPISAPKPTAKPAVESAPTTASTTPAPSINGIPGDMQKSFLSRHKPVFMIFDKDTGKWKSSEGAIKDASTADEWCKQATAIDRRWKRIPETFSYKHVGGGQVEVTRD